MFHRSQLICNVWFVSKYLIRIFQQWHIIQQIMESLIFQAQLLNPVFPSLLPNRGPISNTASIIISIISVTKSPHHLLARCCYWDFFLFNINTTTLRLLHTSMIYVRPCLSCPPPTQRKGKRGILTVAHKSYLGSITVKIMFSPQLSAYVLELIKTIIG